MAMRTITMKLHKPSSIKRKIIDEAITNYNHAYRYLLHKAYDELYDIREKYRDGSGKYRALNITRWIDKGIGKELNKFGIEPFKDSLKLDFGMTLAGYLNLEKSRRQVSYPHLEEFLHNGNYRSPAGVSSVMYSHDGGSKKKNAGIPAKYSPLRPLSFCRYSVNRDFCLLYDNENKKYYVKLYLMNNKNVNKKVMSVSGERKLAYIHESAKMLEESSRKVRFILVPLSFGKWQEEYLKMGIENPRVFKTARLVKRGKDYFLSVNMEIGEPERITTASYMGVSRGLKNPLNFTIIDEKGSVSSSGIIGLPEIKKNVKNSLPLGSLHKIANSIVEEAVKNKARVIVQQLVDRGDRLLWEGDDGRKYIPVLGCHDYNLIVKLLEYKLTSKGLPVPVKVSSTGIFFICPQCGMNAKRNRFSRDMFICTACGKTAEIENLGSLNLARRLMDNRKKTIRITVERTSAGLKFINKDLGLDCSICLQQDIPGILASEIEKVIKDFYMNISVESKSDGFNKKYSLVKRLEQCDDIMELVQVMN